MSQSCSTVAGGGWGGGGGLQCERGRDARRKILIEPLRETNLGVAQPFLITKRYQQAVVTLAKLIQLMVVKTFSGKISPDQ